MSDSLWPHGQYSPWNFSGQNTGVGSLSLLQGIFSTQGSNPGLLHCGQILYQLSHQGNPRILEWAAYPFSRGSSWPRNWTGVSCIAGRFFTNWATREAQFSYLSIYVFIYAFQIPFCYRLFQDIEYSSLCYTVSPWCSSILCSSVYMLTPNS